MKRFSVVIGSYNQADEVPVCLDALLAQTFQDFEVHLCDDGSSDYRAQEQFFNYIAKFHAKNIPFFIHQEYEHSGMQFAKNLNQGIKRARAQYILVISGDMFPAPDYLERLNEVVTPHALVCSFRVNVNPDRSILSYDWRFENSTPESLEPIMFPPVSEPWSAMTGNGMVAPKAFYDAVGNWPEEYTGYGRDDWSLFLKAKKLRYKFFTYTRAIIYHFGESHGVDNPESVERFNKELEDYYASRG